jgi:hypothetical protein
MGRWKVRPNRRTNTLWDVYEPNGQWSGTFDSWGEAMLWATSFSTRVESWLSKQPT